MATLLSSLQFFQCFLLPPNFITPPLFDYCSYMFIYIKIHEYKLLSPFSFSHMCVCLGMITENQTSYQDLWISLSYGEMSTGVVSVLVLLRLVMSWTIEKNQLMWYSSVSVIPNCILKPKLIYTDSVASLLIKACFCSRWWPSKKSSTGENAENNWLSGAQS